MSEVASERFLVDCIKLIDDDRLRALDKCAKYRLLLVTVDDRIGIVVSKTQAHRVRLVQTSENMFEYRSSQLMLTLFHRVRNNEADYDTAQHPPPWPLGLTIIIISL